MPLTPLTRNSSPRNPREGSSSPAGELPRFLGGIDMNFKFCPIVFKSKERSSGPQSRFPERRRHRQALQGSQEKGRVTCSGHLTRLRGHLERQ